VVPTAAIRPSLIASASRIENGPSTVTILPLTRMLSALCARADEAPMTATKAMKQALRNFMAPFRPAPAGSSIAQLDSPLWSGTRRDERGLRTCRHRQVESQLRQHLANRPRVRMLGAQTHQRRPPGSGRRRMRRVPPIDEIGHEAIGDHRIGIGIAPRE